MLIKRPRTFYDSVKPVIYFNCFVGMGVHWQWNLSDTAYLCMRIYTIIIILIHWIMTYIGLAAMRHSTDFNDSSPENRTMFAIIVYTNMSIAATSPLLIWFQRKGLKDCLRQMPILDATFESVFGVERQYRKQYVSLMCRIMAIVLVMFVVGITDVPWIMMRKVSFFNGICIAFTFHYPIIVMLILDLNFCTFTGYLRTKFRGINDSLLRLAKEPTPTSSPGEKIFVISRKVSKVKPDRETDTNPESLVDHHHRLLHELRKAHLELCKLSRKLNHVFGIQNLLSMGISFVIVTGLLFNIYNSVMFDNLTSTRLKQVVPSCVWTVVYMFKIWVINHSCWNVSVEADKIGEVLYELLESRLYKKLKNKMQEFGIQMIQNPVRFNACGFFTLDYAFVQCVIGSITTYLVILIQMSHVSETITSDTAQDRNSTRIPIN